MSRLAIPPATQDFADPMVKLQITHAIEQAIRRSFAVHTMRHVTQAEIKRRFNLCFEGYRVMRNEMKWSRTRCIDHFDRVLDAALAGTKITYANRSSWFGAA